MDIEVLFADAQVLVVHKPAGLLAAPAGAGQSQHPHLPGLLRASWGPVWVVHPLERGASGGMVLARTPTARAALRRAFEAGDAYLVFHALVRGDPPWKERRVTLPLRVQVGRRKRTVIDPQRGRAARTDVRVLARFGSHALVEVRPWTRWRHQIRAHLFALGHPIAGDPLYGPGPQPSDPLAGLALHARRVVFPHPVTGEERRFTVPYPEAWARALDALHWEKALLGRAKPEARGRARGRRPK